MMGCLFLLVFEQVKGQDDCQNLVSATVDGNIGNLDDICFGTTLVQPEDLFISEVGVEFTGTLSQSPSQKYGTGFEITAKANVTYNNYHVAFYRACDIDLGISEVLSFFQVHSENLSFTIPNEQYGYGTAWIPITYPTNINENNDPIYGDNTPCDPQLGEGNYKFYAIAIYHNENGTDILDDFFSIGTGNSNSLYEYGSRVPIAAEDGVAACHYPSNIGSRWNDSNNNPHTHFQFGDGGWVYGDYSISGMLKSPGTLNPNLTDLSLTPYYALRHEFPSSTNLPAIHTVPSIRGKRTIIGTSDANNASFNFPIDFVNKNNLWGDTPDEIEEMYRWDNGVSLSSLKRHRDNVLKAHFLSIKTVEYFQNVHGYILGSNLSDCAYNDILYMIYSGQNNLFSSTAAGQYKWSIMSSDFSSPSIAHEWGHMNNANFSFSHTNYFGLSEAYPDIWGTLVDRYAFNRTNPTYAGIRNLSTYFNIYSSFPMNQYGSNPHDSSRPFAHWFYLLAEGGSGLRTVELPGRCEPYEFTINVNGIGYALAEQIVFEMMDNIDVNNAPNSIFPDDLYFFNFANQVADFLDFKIASEEALDELVTNGTITQLEKPSILNSIEQAWAAIGVAEDFYPDDCIRITCDYTWEHTQMRINKPIYVASGGHLHFPSSSDKYEIFGSNGGIVVEPGGKLTIEGTLSKGNSATRWQGITILGANHNTFPFADNQGNLFFKDENNNAIPYEYPLQEHGVVVLKSGGRVESTEIGIHAPNSYTYATNCNGNSNQTIDSKGGIVVSIRASFGNNLRDVVMDNIHTDGSWGGDNPSIFVDNIFQRSNQTNYGMKFTGFNNLQIKENTFNGNTVSGNGKAILLLDSQINAEDNSFNDLEQAIYKDNLGGSGGCLCGVNELSTFDSNTFTKVQQGITILGGNTDMLLNNTFTKIPEAPENISTYADNTYGIYNIAHLGAEIYNNQFQGFPSLRPLAIDGGGSYGIVVYESEDWTNTAIENKFAGLDYGISTQGYNPFLQINCNLFANNDTAHNATAWAVVDGELPTQGAGCGETITDEEGEIIQMLNPAGNEWGHSTNDCVTSLSKYDMILGQTVESFGYFAHAISPEHRTIPDPTNCIENPMYIILNPCDIQKNEESCEQDDIFVNSPIGIPDVVLVTDIQNIDSELSALENELINEETEKNNTNNLILLKQIEEEIQTLKTKIYRLENAKIRFLGVLGDAVGIEQTLDNSHSAAAKKRLIQLYLAQGLYAKSRTELVNMQQYISSHHLSDYNLYVQLMTTVIDAMEQQRAYTSTELSDLQTIANTGTSSASIQANAILHRLNGEIYHPPIRKIGTNTAKRTLTDNNKNALVQIYPNPTKDILYLQTNSSINGQVYFYNSMGQMKQKLSIDAELQKTNIDVHNWQSGVYYYILYTDEGDNHLGKFIIH